jgi:hypothetical protein
MSGKISRTNSSLDFLNTRLDEIQMSNYERLRAKARLAQAEAIANAVAEFFNLAKRLLTALVVRPVRRLAHLA